MMNLKLKSLIESKPIPLTFLKNTVQDVYKNVTKTVISKEIDLPKNFDGREVWKPYLSRVRNQGKCGSCWAFATTSTLADRFNIQSNGKFHLLLSPTKMVLCDFIGDEFKTSHPEKNVELLNQLNVESLNKGACSGNTLADAWRYLYIMGTCEESCLPYHNTLGTSIKFDSISSYTKNSKLPLCSEVSGSLGDMCSNIVINNITGEEYGDPARFYRCFHYYAVDGKDDYEICRDIFFWGPVSSGITIYADFYTFNPKKDIYSWDGNGEQVGGHAIEIVGWGERNSTKYWIVKNSWGDNWGMKGYFYIKRGVNMCGIEENIMTGMPDFFYADNTEFPESVLKHFVWSESVNKLIRQSYDAKFTARGGGIDPISGYSRRVIATKPWLDFSRPISDKDIPDWENYIAGINSNVQSKSNNHHKILKIFIAIFLCIFLTILIIKMKKYLQGKSYIK